MRKSEPADKVRLFCDRVDRPRHLSVLFVIDSRSIIESIHSRLLSFGE
jgi:hypothetical protein